MKKRILSIMICICMAAGMIAGCGKKEEKAGTEEGKEGGEEQIELTILSTLITENEAPLEQAMADKYMEEHPNVKINLVGQPVNEMAKKIVALNSSDELPDAFFMPTEFMAQAYDMGIIVDHEEVLGQEYIDTLNEKVVEYGKIEGQLMMVPWHVIPVGLVYRSDWLKDAGMDTIETMDDFNAAAKAFTKDGAWGFSMVGTQNGSGETRFVQYARAFGVNEVYQNDSGEWASDLTGDKYKKALQSFVDLAVKDEVVPPGATETGYPEASAYFAEEKTGLMITGSNAIGAIISANPELDGKLASLPIPSEERHVTNLQTSGYAITTACEHPDVLADYLKFMTDKENAVDFAVQSGRLPVTKEALEDEAFKTDAFKGFIDCMQYALPQPSFAAYTEVLDVMGESYSTMIGKGTSIDEAMKQVESRMNTILSENQ